MRKQNRLVWFVALLLGLTLIMAACAGDGETNGNAGDNGDEEDKTDNNDSNNANNSSDSDDESTGGGDLVISIGADIVSLSTHGENDVPSSNVQDNIYESLTTLDEDQEVQPGLAKDWEEVDDTTWDFFLREDVEFHDGEPLNAEAVKTNFERLVDEDIGSPRAFLLEQVESVEVQDEYTVRLNLEYAYAPLLANLAHTGTSIMSPAIIEEDYAMMDDGEDPGSYISQNPAGTGPFKFESWTPGEKVVIKRNENYWGDKAKLDTATFKVVSEQSSRIAELESGESDVADSIGPSNISRIKGMQDANLLQEPSVSLSYIGFNVEKEPFDDKKVRQAISKAIDKEEIIEGVYEGAGIPAVGPLAPPVFGYDDSIDGLEYDKEEAKELLAEAGYEDGFETTIWTNDDEQRIDTAVAIQSQLSEIGVDVEVQELEWGAYLERTANGEHDMFILGWSTVTSDADYGMYPLFHSSQHGDPGNRSFLSNDKVDEALEEARRATDPEKRKELYKKAQEILVDVAPMLYIHHQEYLLGVDNSVKDFGIDAQGIYQIQETYIE